MGFVICAYFDNCVMVLVICVLVFTVSYIVCTVYFYCFIDIFLFLFVTNVRTTVTFLKLNYIK